MQGINRVFIVGIVGHDPEPRTTPSGKVVTEISIATNNPRRENDRWVEHTTWHRVTAWEHEADVAIRFLRKGSPVAIEGSMRTDTWTDVNGMRRSKTYVVCQRMTLLPGGPRQNESRRDQDDTGGPPIIDQDDPRYEPVSSGEAGETDGTDGTDGAADGAPPF